MDLSEIEKLDAPAKVLKLSTAMRIGIKKRPIKCSRTYYRNEDASCALGAAFEGAGYNIHACCVKTLTRLFGDPIILSKIAARNDNGESREAIATWLESQGY